MCNKIRSYRELIMKKVRRLLLIIIALASLYIIANAISICRYGKIDEKCKADVAIVLGAATYDGKVSPVYQERINHAIDLYVNGYIKKIIMTGGKAKGNSVSDAYAAKQYAISKGVLDEDILLEEKSAITQENLSNTKIVMNENGMKTAILVSDPLHMKRSMLLAKDIGIKAYSSPTPTTKYISTKTKVPFLARELFFYIGYKIYRVFYM
jgi:uncharacterized SAM-binding protein YcdF (DUF218 family)